MPPGALLLGKHPVIAPEYRRDIDTLRARHAVSASRTSNFHGLLYLVPDRFNQRKVLLGKLSRLRL